MIKRRKVIFSVLSFILRILVSLLYFCTAAIIGPSNIDVSFKKFWSIRIGINSGQSEHFWSFITNFSFSNNVILLLALDLLVKRGATVFQKILL